MRKLLVAAVLAGAVPAHAQTLAERVDKYLAPVVSSRDFNGLVLIARGDKPVVQRAFGRADFELDSALKLDSRFRIASITKTFTAAAIVMLVEQGKIGYDDPLAKYLPDFPNADKITIRQLLLHRAGVPNPSLRPCSEATTADVIADLAQKPLWFEPGKGNAYSNGGYAVLAAVLEKVTGKTWEAHLGDAIFKPLGMLSTMRDAEETIVPGRATGYISAPGALGVMNAPCQSAGGAIGSGALLSTAGDLHRWARAYRNETLFKNKGLEWPYGWGARTYHERPAVEQNGILNGFASYLALYPDDDLYVVVLANLQTGILTPMGIGLAGLALGKDVEPLTPSPATASLTAIASGAEQRAKWLGRYRNPQVGMFRLVERNGALYQIWEDAATGSYVFITGANTAYNRQETARMTLDGDTIRVSWSGSEAMPFQRE